MLSLCECLGDAVLGKDDEESAAIAFKHDVELAVALPDLIASNMGSPVVLQGWSHTCTLPLFLLA